MLSLCVCAVWPCKNYETAQKKTGGTCPPGQDLVEIKNDNMNTIDKKLIFSFCDFHKVSFPFRMAWDHASWSCLLVLVGSLGSFCKGSPTGYVVAPHDVLAQFASFFNCALIYFVFYRRLCFLAHRNWDREL